MTDAPSKPTLLARPWAQAVVLGVVCLLVYWPMLGSGGLVATEGHRSVPAWEMLRSGDFVVTRMFDQAYLRKPPGIAWAIAGTSALFGQTEFGARAASALAASAMAFVAFGFSWRWFGARWALAGGLTQALTAWIWTVGRQAEIEAAHQLGVQVACLALVDALVVKRARRGALVPGVWMVVAGLGLAWMALTKGPAGLPAVVGAAVAAFVVRRSARPLASARLWVPIALAAVVSGAVFGLIQREIAHSGERPVMPLTGTHLFGAGWVLGALALVPGALIAMLPGSLAMLFPWGPDARREGESAGEGARFELCRALAWAVLASLGAYLCTGIANVRYTMPAAVFVAPLAAGVARGVLGGGYTPARRAIGRAMLLGHPAVLAGVLVAGSWVWIATGERAQRAKSGREAGREIAALLAESLSPDELASARVWADHMVEARPEVLEWARRGLGGHAGFAWVPGLVLVEEVPPGTVLVLRADEASPERGMGERLVEKAGAFSLGSGGFGKFGYRVVWVPGGTGGM